MTCSGFICKKREKKERKEKCLAAPSRNVIDGLRDCTKSIKWRVIKPKQLAEETIKHFVELRRTAAFDNTGAELYAS